MQTATHAKWIRVSSWVLEAMPRQPICGPTPIPHDQPCQEIKLRAPMLYQQRKPRRLTLPRTHSLCTIPKLAHLMLQNQLDDGKHMPYSRKNSFMASSPRSRLQSLNISPTSERLLTKPMHVFLTIQNFIHQVGWFQPNEYHSERSFQKRAISPLFRTTRVPPLNKASDNHGGGQTSPMPCPSLPTEATHIGIKGPGWASED
jgi:hypothetical protein